MSGPMQSSPSPSIYNPLSSRSHEIRILNFRYRAAGLYAELETVSLTNPGLYVALSYMWGDTNSNVSMEIFNPRIQVQANFTTKANLYAALKHLYDLGHRRIWADAICINQADDEERSLQVRNMQLIYSKAVQVIASVGEVDRSEAMLIQSYLENFQSRDPIIYGLVKFFSEPYWARVWIIQELAVAEKLHLIYGGVILAWNKIATILRHKYAPEILGDQASYATHIMNLRDKYQADDPISLFEAMQCTHKSQAKIPRDKIFALLGLSADGSRLVRLPNYSQDLWSLFTELTVQILNMERSLDLICLGRLNGDGQGPTWVPDWLNVWSDSTPKTLLESRILQERVSSSKFIKIPIQMQPPVLKIRGVYSGIVRNISTPWGSQTQHDLSSDEFRAIYLPEPTSSMRSVPVTIHNALADTLCLGWQNINKSMFATNISLGGSKVLVADNSHSRYFQMLWTLGGRGMIRNIDMIRWIDQNATIPIVISLSGEYSLAEISRYYYTSATSSTTRRIEFNPQVIESFTSYVDKVIEALSSGLLFVVTSGGAIGMAPPATRKGDTVYFLEGSSYPVILRPLSYTKMDYAVVGASYFHEEVLPRPNDPPLAEITVH